MLHISEYRRKKGGDVEWKNHKFSWSNLILVHVYVCVQWFIWGCRGLILYNDKPSR